MNEDTPLIKTQKKEKAYSKRGVETEWYQGWDISEDERQKYSDRSRKSALEKAKAVKHAASISKTAFNKPNLNPKKLMRQCKKNGFEALSLFSGGGGLDLGFERAGFNHVASYELLDFAAETLQRNMPKWKIYGGQRGDVTEVRWKKYRNKVDVIHGGPPCQPFSMSGRQNGKNDVRDMFPEFIRCVLEVRPKVFVAENVPGLTASKFQRYIQSNIIGPLKGYYKVASRVLNAASFGVPQVRRRLVFVGVRDKKNIPDYFFPEPTHSWKHFSIKNKNQLDLELSTNGKKLKRCMGAREALGLPDIGFDQLAPTIRSSLTGPRQTTSILSSTSALETWRKLGIWPNGVQSSRQLAHAFPAKDNLFRLSTLDCAILQGFPEDWNFGEVVYKATGQIGNSVCPPMAYNIAKSVDHFLKSS